MKLTVSLVLDTRVLPVLVFITCSAPNTRELTIWSNSSSSSPASLWAYVCTKKPTCYTPSAIDSDGMSSSPSSYFQKHTKIEYQIAS